MTVVSDLAMSLDGFVAGPNQSHENPFGEGIGDALHRWMFEQPDENADALAAMNAPSAFIMGRNMFGPGRGDWDLDWKGWWGDEPPYHGPVFVLTHHERAPLAMAGGTTFTFVTDGIDAALDQARQAAGDGDVGIVGGADTVRQFLAAGHIDELRLHITPAIVGAGERLLDGLTHVRLEPTAAVGNALVTHMTYRVVR